MSMHQDVDFEVAMFKDQLNPIRHEVAMTMQTAVCDLFGIKVPVFSAGMGVGSGAALAAAVSNAGGCGVIGGNGRTNNGLLNEIRQMRALSSKPFAVNLLPAVAREGMIDACIGERPPIITFFLGDPRLHPQRLWTGAIDISGEPRHAESSAAVRL